MAKKRTAAKYGKFPNCTGDLWTAKGKFSLDGELTQEQMKSLYEQGRKDIIYKIGG